MASTDERLGKLEVRFAVVATTVATLFGVFGIASVVLLPKMAKQAADKAMSEYAGNELAQLLNKARADSKLISEIAKDSTLNVGGQCFKPKRVVRCNRGLGSYFDTWVDIGCSGPWVKDGEMVVLAQCDAH